MKNFKPLALASLVSLASTGVAAGPLNDLLGTQGLSATLDAAARSVQGQASSNNPAASAGFGQTNTPTLFGVTVFEPANRQNADIAALSFGSGDNTGNGGVVGVAVLAGDDSGSGGVFGVNALSPNEALTLGLAGQETTVVGNELDPVTTNFEAYGAGQMNESLYNAYGREEQRGTAYAEQAEDGARGARDEYAAQSGPGASSDTATGTVDQQAGSSDTQDAVVVSGGEGNDSGSGSDVGVAAMSDGSDTAQSDQAGVAVVSGDNAARGDAANVAVAGGDSSARGGIVNAAALSGANSAEGGVVNAQAANEPSGETGNDDAVLNFALLHRSENVGQGLVGIGIVSIEPDTSPNNPAEPKSVAVSTADESEKCGSQGHEVTIRGIPVIAGPRMGTQFADSRAETKIGECARAVDMASGENIAMAMQ